MVAAAAKDDRDNIIRYLIMFFSLSPDTEAGTRGLWNTSTIGVMGELRNL